LCFVVDVVAVTSRSENAFVFFFETAKILLNTFGYKIYTKKKERKKELKLSTHTGC
jgi:hypothetical protein